MREKEPGELLTGFFIFDHKQIFIQVYVSWEKPGLITFLPDFNRHIADYFFT